jgi:hypothetical protein
VRRHNCQGHEFVLGAEHVVIPTRPQIGGKCAGAVSWRSFTFENGEDSQPPYSIGYRLVPPNF